MCQSGWFIHHNYDRQGPLYLYYVTFMTFWGYPLTSGYYFFRYTGKYFLLIFILNVFGNGRNQREKYYA